MSRNEKTEIELWSLAFKTLDKKAFAKLIHDAGLFHYSDALNIIDFKIPRKGENFTDAFVFSKDPLHNKYKNKKNKKIKLFSSVLGKVRKFIIPAPSANFVSIDPVNTEPEKPITSAINTQALVENLNFLFNLAGQEDSHDFINDVNSTVEEYTYINSLFEREMFFYCYLRGGVSEAEDTYVTYDSNRVDLSYARATTGTQNGSGTGSAFGSNLVFSGAGSTRWTDLQSLGRQSGNSFNSADPGVNRNGINNIIASTGRAHGWGGFDSSGTVSSFGGGGYGIALFPLNFEQEIYIGVGRGTKTGGEHVTVEKFFTNSLV